MLLKGLCESIGCRTVALKTRHELSVGPCNMAVMPFSAHLEIPCHKGKSHKGNPREKVAMLLLVDCILVTDHYQVSVVILVKSAILFHLVKVVTTFLIPCARKTF